MSAPIVERIARRASEWHGFLPEYEGNERQWHMFAEWLLHTITEELTPETPPDKAPCLLRPHELETIKNEHLVGLLLYRMGIPPEWSTGIHGEYTAGYGKLDPYGFWQYPLPAAQFRLERNRVDEKT